MSSPKGFTLLPAIRPAVPVQLIPEVPTVTFVAWTFGRGSVIWKIWPAVLLHTLFSIGVVYIYKITGEKLEVPNVMLTVLGVVIGFVISYRAMSGYDRYWMGRVAWSNVIKDARALGRIIWYHCPPRLTPKTPEEIASGKVIRSTQELNKAMAEKRMALDLVLGFAVALKHHIRGELGIYYDDLYHLVRPLHDHAHTAKQQHRHMLDSAAAVAPRRNPGMTSSSHLPVATGKTHVAPPPSTAAGPPAQFANSSIYGTFEGAGSRNGSRTSLLRKSPSQRTLRRSSSTESHHEALMPAVNPLEQGGEVATDLIPFAGVFSGIRRWFGKKEEPVLPQYHGGPPPRKWAGPIHPDVKLMKRKPETGENLPEEVLRCLSEWASVLEDRGTLMGDFGWHTVPAVFVGAFIYLGFVAAGEEIEQPFGYDENDLDLDLFCQDIIRVDIESLKAAPCLNAWLAPHERENGREHGLVRHRSMTLTEATAHDEFDEPTLAPDFHEQLAGLDGAAGDLGAHRWCSAIPRIPPRSLAHKPGVHGTLPTPTFLLFNATAQRSESFQDGEDRRRLGPSLSYRAAAMHLSAPPRLAAYVKNLEIYLRKPRVPWYLGPYCEPDSADDEAITLAVILDRLTQSDVMLERIKIRVPVKRSDWAGWMSSSVQRLIAHATHREAGVQHLSIKVIDNIPLSSIYRALWACSSLALEDTYLTEEPILELPAKDDFVGTPSLRKLKLSSTDHLYQLLLHPVLRRCTNSLVALSIDGLGPPYGDHVVLGLKLAALCSDTLEELTVKLFGLRVNEDDTVPHDLPRLRTLRLLAPYEELKELKNWILPRAFASLLRHPSTGSLPALENLRIYLGITLDHRPPPVPPLASHYILSPHFESLDGALQPYLASEIAVEFGVRHHLFYKPETPEERREDLARHYAAFGQGLRAVLRRSFGSGLKLVRWDG
uniref:Uncharacterized protein n=1 Tax=Mycena chlorophos TaxID=658473 RepID=A0ABQ0LUK0_MYCCL|nr:predicted protein [Mycena chlorophos]